MARATVSPPTPESKMPIGAVLSGRMPPACVVPISPVRLALTADRTPSQAPSSSRAADRRVADRRSEGPPPGSGEGPSHAVIERRSCSAGQPAAQQRLALLGALAAVRLRLAEQVRDLVVPVALGVLDVGLQAQGVVQACLGV